MGTYLHILKTVLLTYAAEDIFLAAFLHLSCQKEFIEDKIGLLEVEYDIKFAHIAIIFVHLFNVTVHNLESDQFVVGGRAACDEEKGGITTIDYFAV